MYGKSGYQVLRSTENNLSALNKMVENISNINSVGYKRGTTTFAEALNGEANKYESKDFSQGPLRKTGDLYDLALEGKGFFGIELPNGQRAYTRAGRFKLTGEGELVTEEGYRVLADVEQAAVPAVLPSRNGNGEIDLNIKVKSSKLIIPADLTAEITEDGSINGIDSNTGEKKKIGKINVVVFNNTDGLESLGKSYFVETNSSGPALEADVGPDSSSRVKQGFLEFGNVSIVTEFMNMTHIKDLLGAQFKLLKAIDKMYENVH